MIRRPGLGVWVVLTTLLTAGFLPVAIAHLCDNVYRQPDKLIVKPEITNIIVKDAIRFKLYLQNNMDRGIEQIRLGALSEAFDVKVSPEQMGVPQGARVFFEVELKTKPDVPAGNYPLQFRLYAVKGGGEQEFKRFLLAGTVACVVPRLKELQEEPGSEAQETIRIDGAVAERAWREALVLSNFRSTDGKPAEPQTVVLTAFDSKALYFALTCLKGADDPEDIQDTLTVNLSPYGRGQLYALAFRKDGAVRMSVQEGSEVERLSPRSVRFRAAGGEDEWVVETALPWAVFGMDKPPEPGETWLLNIVRARAGDKPQTSFWAGSPEDYEKPEGYGRLLFAPQP